MNRYAYKLEGIDDGWVQAGTRRFARYAGIPPGPISSVTEGAIEAALNPAETNYLFYVLNVEANDGSHHFYASAAEFERGKAVYQRWLEEQRRLKREAEAAQ